MKNLGLGALVFLAMTSAKAGILIEPYMGVESGTMALKTTAGVDIGGAVSATTLGARLGYKLPMMFWLAADYGMGTGGKFKSLVDYDYDRTNLCFDVGVDFPILFRAWLGYGLQNSFKGKASGQEFTFKEGSFTKLGVAYSGLPFVSINLEYYMWSPGKLTDSAGNTTTASDSYSTLQDTGVNVGVSLPFNL